MMTASFVALESKLLAMPKEYEMYFNTVEFTILAMRKREKSSE